MKLEKNRKFEYLTNITNDKFIMCKKIEYPIIKTYSDEISNQLFHNLILIKDYYQGTVTKKFIITIFI